MPNIVEIKMIFPSPLVMSVCYEALSGFHKYSAHHNHRYRAIARIWWGSYDVLQVLQRLHNDEGSATGQNQVDTR